ncbi:MAG TPA: BatD family protein [Gemmatimonadales bacterium]|nr:BatD family protein [Gemmatimonadales bacterium]
MLWLLFALQGLPPDVQASVDRTRLTAGDQLTLTVRARTRSAEPVSITFPPLTGFAIIGSREVSEVAIDGARGPTRTTMREVQLRAVQPGALMIGAVRVRQGEQAVATDPIAITVDSAAAGVAGLLSPFVRALIAAADPPEQLERVSLAVILPADTMLTGGQLDVIAAAWFPRELRPRLHGRPILTMQTPEGVWSYPGAAPSDVAASRLVRGRWMDLFVAHQIVFPLAPGRVVIPPAMLEYAMLVRLSFFGREERYSLKSDSVAVTVLPLPEPGRSGDDERVVAQGLSLALGVAPAESRVGEPLDVTATISGVGNVALWPEPAIRWPPGFRAYPGETGMRLEPRHGRMAGSKTFHYLVVPDSAGAFVLPEIRYPYYDLATGTHVAARAAAQPLAVAPGAEPRAARPVPALDPSARATSADEVAAGLVPWGWLALLVGPPLAAWLWRRRGAAHDTLAPPSGAAPPLTRLGRLEREFYAVLASHVPDRGARDGDGLARALRAAGLESAVADHVKRLRDRLRAARYGPQGIGDAAELAAEVEQVLKVLGADPVGGPGARDGGGRRVVTTLCFVALAVPPAARAQAPSAEALYEAGALRAASDSFAARATAEPRVAAHWYNLGATLYRAGADGKAAAAWALAARMAPRAPLLRRARQLLPPPDAPSESLLAVGPVTPAEWALVAAVAWLALWTAVVARWRRSVLLGFALVTAVTAGLAVREWQHRRRGVAVVVNAGTPVRVAPYGEASAATRVEPGAALLVERSYGAWLEVRRRDGVHGWVLASEVVGL